MPISDAFQPVIDPGTKTQTCVQVTSGAASAKTKIKGNEVLVKCLTQSVYIRLGDEASAAVSASNGYYMAVGDEVRWQTSKGADHLYYIESGTAGVLSIAYGTGS